MLRGLTLASTNFYFIRKVIDEKTDGEEQVQKLSGDLFEVIIIEGPPLAGDIIRFWYSCICPIVNEFLRGNCLFLGCYGDGAAEMKSEDVRAARFITRLVDGA